MAVDPGQRVALRLRALPSGLSVRIVVAATGQVLAERAELATTFGARLRGLVGRPPLAPGEALVLVPAAQVHTWFMACAIDVVFCAPDWTVLHVVRNMGPWRMTRWVRGARYALELPAGGAPASLARGARLEPLGGVSGRSL